MFQTILIYSMYSEVKKKKPNLQLVYKFILDFSKSYYFIIIQKKICFVFMEITAIAQVQSQFGYFIRKK